MFRHDSEHAQNDGQSVDRGLPVFPEVAILCADQKERGLWALYYI